MAATAAVVAAHVIDGWAYDNLSFPSFHASDLGRWFRVLGFLPLWMTVALVFVLQDWPRGAPGARGPAVRRGVVVIGAASLGGIIAEALKILFRRERPLAHDGAYVFRPWSEDPFYTGSLGLPSSHVLVAAAACLTLARLFPRTRYVWYGLIAACAFSRVASRAHFVSDVVLAAIGGVVVAAVMWRWYERKPVPSVAHSSPR